MKTKIDKAKSRLVLSHPFFSSILLGCKVVEDSTLSPPTMATDGTTIWYHPGVELLWSVDECIGVLAHEVMHIVCLHPWRRGSRDQRKANRAMDYAINHVLETSGFTLPKGRLREAEYDGKCFEVIYSMLKDPPPKQGEGQGEGQG